MQFFNPQHGAGGLGICIFAMMTLQGGNYNEAALIAQHKRDELRSAKFAALGSPAERVG